MMLLPWRDTSRIGGDARHSWGQWDPPSPSLPSLQSPKLLCPKESGTGPVAGPQPLASRQTAGWGHRPNPWVGAGPAERWTERVETSRTLPGLHCPPSSHLVWKPHAHRDLDVGVGERAALRPRRVEQGVLQLPAVGRHLQEASPAVTPALPDSGICVTRQVRPFCTRAVPPASRRPRSPR